MSRRNSAGFETYRLTGGYQELEKRHRSRRMTVAQRNRR